MRWPSDILPGSLVILTVGAACDYPEQDLVGPANFAPIQAVPAPAPARPTDALMVYEDEEDHAILHDTSNLRPPGMSLSDYRRLLQEPAREELRQLLPDASPATTADLDLLSLRWFVQGAGIIVQNRSERSFSVAAHFSSSTDPDCEFSVPWKVVSPKGSAMFTAHDDDECPVDHAAVTVNDEYGLFVDSVGVERSEEPR